MAENNTKQPNDAPKEIVFNANVSSIVNFEKTTGKSIMRAFSTDISVTTVIELVKCISNADDEAINEYVKAKGFNALVNEAVKALETSGFLEGVTEK